LEVAMVIQSLHQDFQIQAVVVAVELKTGVVMVVQELLLLDIGLSRHK
jgi:hypothetical protein